jgi:hypothetical protein
MNSERADIDKEDIEASESANVDLLERPLSKLKEAMSTLPRDSDAWGDFESTFRPYFYQDLEGKTVEVGVPPDLWDYWTKVAAGECLDYDIQGSREVNDV